MVKKTKSDSDGVNQIAQESTIQPLQIQPTQPPSQPPPQPPPPTEAVPVKKKEMTPARKEAVNKMFEGLKAKREADKLAQETDTQEQINAKEQRKLQKKYMRREAKKLPDVTSYVTMQDLEYFKNELIGVMPKTIYKEVPVDRIVPKLITVPVETVREKIVPVIQPPKKITGNELLDSIFFR
jgi:hypothetical protein